VRAFGETNFAFQFANILFIALLLIAISAALPNNRFLALLGPGLVVAATPGLLSYSISGYGEGAVAALVLSAIVLLVRSIYSDKASWQLLLSGLLVGSALTIKTVAVGAIPVTVVLFILALTQNDHRLRLFFTHVFGFLLPIAGFEAYRARSLRGGYVDWWRDQFQSIRGQAADDSGGAKESMTSKIYDHMHLLSSYTGVQAWLWVVLLMITCFIALATMILWGKIVKSSVPNLQRVFIGAFYSYALLYLVWWLAITPTEKAWLRRITIGLFAFMMATMLLANVYLSSLARHVRPMNRVTNWRLWTGLVVASIFVVIGFPALKSNINSMKTSGSNLESVEEVSGELEELSEYEGSEFFGDGWWSAPVLSLYSGIDIGNTRLEDFCTSDSVAELVDPGAYLVWDSYAENLSGGLPSIPGIKLEKTDISNSSGTIWKMIPDSASCPSN
jgi:hypothetical protein